MKRVCTELKPVEFVFDEIRYVFVKHDLEDLKGSWLISKRENWKYLTKALAAFDCQLFENQRCKIGPF